MEIKIIGIERHPVRNHYRWLDKHLLDFYRAIDLPDAKYMGDGGIVAHGDKCYGYRFEWESKGIPFEHGVAIYLLTYLRPYANEVRETRGGWIAPKDWVIANYNKFASFLPTVEGE